MKNLAIVLAMSLMTLSVTAQKVAIGPVLNVVVYVPEDDKYITSTQGLVENPYTDVVILKLGNIMTFKVYKENEEEPMVSIYRITKRAKGRKVIYAEKIDDGSGDMIKIVQKKFTTELHCGYDVDSNRFKSAFVFGELNFSKLKSVSLDYLN